MYDWNENDNRELGFTLHPKKLHYEEYDEVNPETVIFNEKTIRTIGSRGYTRENFNYTADLIINQKIDPLHIVSKVLKFDENILENLLSEGEKETNIKILMSPYEEFLEKF